MRPWLAADVGLAKVGYLRMDQRRQDHTAAKKPTQRELFRSLFALKSIELRDSNSKEV